MEPEPPQDYSIPERFSRWIPIRDELETETSQLQDETIQECLPYLARCLSSDPDEQSDFTTLPTLARDEHIQFLHRSLGTMPSAFVGYDAARPWIVYWVLTALSLLGEDVSQYRERVTKTFSSMQNASGGFSGGHGQISHCAPSYAAILSLAMVGGTESLNLIDRKALWHWLGQIKQQDGGFRVCINGEEDVRYGSLVLARKAGLESFMDGLPEYMSRCQTFEGGISGSPQTEAHGAYAFCALACLSILGAPHVMISGYLDINRLISWLSSRQSAPEGGFSGRTNKLVDGCYSHWVGGCWPLLEAAIDGPATGGPITKSPKPSLYSQSALAMYITACCQAESGGLRDKPSKYPDAYHSCYTLAGLSSLQNHNYYHDTVGSSQLSSLDHAFQWRSMPTFSKAEMQSGTTDANSQERLTPIHPIFVIPWAAVEATASFYETKEIL
ncbi:MAG: hypothetical protein Q9222_005258 [Ikaeria aurantiellina]